MKYEDFIKLFQAKVNSLSYQKQLNLAISVCKKLFPDYNNFYLENNWGDPNILLDAIKICELFDLNKASILSIKKLLTKVNEITPSTEDFENASFALNATAAVYETLEFLIDNDKKHIFNIGTYLADTIDFKIQEEDGLTQQQIDNHPLMIEVQKYLLVLTSF